MIGRQIAISTLSTFGLLRKDGFLATKLLSDSGTFHPKRWEKKDQQHEGFWIVLDPKNSRSNGPLTNILGIQGFQALVHSGEMSSILMKRSLYQPSLSFVTYMGDFL